MLEDNTENSQETVQTVNELIAFTRRNDIERNPRMRHRDSLVLRDTSKMVLWAEYSEIIDEHTGKIHHNALKLASAKKTSIKFGNQIIVSESNVHSIWLNEENGEVGAFVAFLASIGQFSGDPGDYIIAPARDNQIEPKVLNKLISLATGRDQATYLLRIFDRFDNNPELLEQLAEVVEANPDAARVAAASLNLARYSMAIEELRELIEGNAVEGDFQALLEKNPWMFGGEYSARVDRRRFTRDENADFMMRRTVDDYLELIEIKRPVARSLFVEDASHDSYYPSSELSRVLGQVIKYLDEIDASRDNIERRDGVKINKLRARIIIGLDHGQDQVDALRQYNSHLHRIEILTFDQLVRTAERVRDHLQEALEPVFTNTNLQVDDVPF